MHGEMFGSNATLGFYYYWKYGGFKIVSAIRRLRPMTSLLGSKPNAALTCYGKYETISLKVLVIMQVTMCVSLKM